MEEPGGGGCAVVTAELLSIIDVQHTGYMTGLKCKHHNLHLWIFDKG